MGKKSMRLQSSGGKRPVLGPESIALMRLVEAGKHNEIEVAARRILDKHPRHSLAIKALGFALIGTARYEAALPMIEEALCLNPGDPELHNNHGIALSMLMRWDQSVAAFSKSISLQPNHPETLKNLGMAYIRMHRWNEAVPPLIKAIEVHQDDYVEAIALLADALLNANRVDEAWTCYQELWRADSENLWALSQLVTAGLRRCDWVEFREHLATLRRRTGNFSTLTTNPFGPLAWPGVAGHELIGIAENHAREQIPADFLNLERSDFDLLSKEPPKRLRIAYLSADFRNHPVGQVVAEVIEHHNRDRVEVLAYSLYPGDGSPLRARLERAFDRFFDLSMDTSVIGMARKIRDEGVHILVDLSGWTSEGRPESLALRCAPVQVNWLGYPGTMGHAKLSDYLIGDSVVTPDDHADFYSECVARMPSSYFPVDTLSQPAPAPSRPEAGLPESGFIFCSFNNSYKFNPDVFDLWSRILGACPDSYLWLSQPSGTAKDNLKREIAARGIDSQRLLFAPRVEGREDHLGRLRLADLALDTFPYNSHSTAADALLAGVPMVSLLGGTFAGRVGASLLKAANLAELVAETQQEYFHIATGLFRNTARLADLRAGLAKRESVPLFDMARFASNLENLYFRMWDDFRSGVRRAIALD